MDNELLIILTITILVIIVVIYLKPNLSSDINNTKRSDHEKPTDFVKNDKLIIIKDVKLNILKKAIVRFCNIYNQSDWNVLPKLIVGRFNYIVTFPYDIEFDIFCYFINYIKYPTIFLKHTNYKPDIKAWASTKSNDKWMKPDIENKKVMLFIPDWDDEFDNVYLTTQDNKGFLMGFAMGEMSKKLEKPIIDFKKRPIDMKITKLTETTIFD